MRSTFHDDSCVEELPRRRKLTPEESFGNTFREQRMLAHFTQKRLAEESGVSLDLIIDFENGERRCREVTLGQMEKIAKVLGKELTIDPLPNYETSATTLGMLLYHARKERKPLRAIFDEL